MCCAYLERALWYALKYMLTSETITPRRPANVMDSESLLTPVVSFFPLPHQHIHSFLAFLFWNQHSYFVSLCCCIPHNSSRWLLSDKTPLHLRSPPQLGDICAVSSSELCYIQLLWSLLYKVFCGYMFRSVLGKDRGMGGLPQIAALTH